MLSNDPKESKKGLKLDLTFGKPIKEGLEFANKAAGLSTTKLGAGDGMPFFKDLS